MSLVTSPYANANSYVSVAEARIFLSQRLYSTSFIDASSTPDATGYVANGNLVIGTSTLPITGGTGIFVAGNDLRIAGQYYRVKTTTKEGDTTVTLVSGLTTTIGTGSSIERMTMSPQEASLHWATQILDRCFVWEGTPTYVDQALCWPRYSVLDRNGNYYDSTVVPELVRRLTAEFAAYLLSRDTSKLPAVLGTGLKSTTNAAKEQIEIDPKNVVSLIPPYIKDQLSSVGYAVGGTGGISFSRVLRA